MATHSSILGWKIPLGLNSRTLVWFLLQNLGEFLFLILLRECGWVRTNWYQLPIYFLHVCWGNWIQIEKVTLLLFIFRFLICQPDMLFSFFWVILGSPQLTSIDSKISTPWSFLFISLLSVYASFGDYSARFVDKHCFCFLDWIMGFLRARIISVSLCFAWRCTHKPDWK